MPADLPDPRPAAREPDRAEPAPPVPWFVSDPPPPWTAPDTPQPWSAPDTLLPWSEPDTPAEPPTRIGTTGPGSADPPPPWPAPDMPAEWPARTVTAEPARLPAVPEPGPLVPPVPPWQMPPRSPYQVPGNRRPSSTTPWIVAAVLVLIAVGGGTFALVRIADTPSAGPAPTQAAATGPSSQPQGTLPASQAASASAAPSASPTPPTSSPGLVITAPGVGPVPPQVEVVLTHYFLGINDHSYTEYASSETAPQSQASFDSGFATTTDSDMTLTSLTSAANGELAATVTFTSHQSPSGSIDNSACNNWTLTLNLAPHGAGYLITPPPSGYEPTYTDC